MGAETIIVAGTMKATRLVVPTTVVTVVALVVAAVPPAAGDKLMVTEAGWIVPAGKLEPVRVMLVTPGCPELGVTAVESVTWVWAVAVTDSRRIRPRVWRRVRFRGRVANLGLGGDANVSSRSALEFGLRVAMRFGVELRRNIHRHPNPDAVTSSESNPPPHSGPYPLLSVTAARQVAPPSLPAPGLARAPGGRRFQFPGCTINRLPPVPAAAATLGPVVATVVGTTSRVAFVVPATTPASYLVPALASSPEPLLRRIPLTVTKDPPSPQYSQFSNGRQGDPYTAHSHLRPRRER